MGDIKAMTNGWVKLMKLNIWINVAVRKRCISKGQLKSPLKTRWIVTFHIWVNTLNLLWCFDPWHLQTSSITDRVSQAIKVKAFKSRIDDLVVRHKARRWTDVSLSKRVYDWWLSLLRWKDKRMRRNYFISRTRIPSMN